MGERRGSGWLHCASPGSRVSAECWETSAHRRGTKSQHKANGCRRISRLSFFSHQGVGQGVVTKLHLHSSRCHATLCAHRNSPFSVRFLPFLQCSFICYGCLQLIAAGWELSKCWAVEQSRSVGKFLRGSDHCSYVHGLQQRQGSSWEIGAAQSWRELQTTNFLTRYQRLSLLRTVL